MIEFDEATHTYTDTETGEDVTSVTTALGVLDSYRGIPRDILEKASERGTKVHKAVELYLQDDLDELSLDPTIASYFYSYVRFERETGFRSRHSELRVHSRKFRFAGTLDLEGDDPNYRGKGKAKPSIIDIKSSVELMPSVGPQLAAYEKARIEETGDKRKHLRYGLLLKPDGSYQLKQYTDSADWSVFLACLTVHNYRSKTK